MFCSRKDNLAIAVVLPAHGPPVITIRCTLGGPSLSDDAFQVVRFWRVPSSSQRVRAASVAQGAACLNLSAARHMVARGGGVELCGGVGELL